MAFLIGDDPKRDRCSDARHPRAADLARLRRALGDDAVWCIDPPAFSKLWPGFFDGVAKLPWTHPLPPPRQAPHWRYRASNSLGWHWAWAAACDLPGLVGVLIRNSRGGELAAWWKARGFRWLWTLDWDVGWTGDLAGILAAFGDQKHDYLAGAPPHLADPTWFPFFPLRNHLADHQVYQTLVVPQRFSSLKVPKEANARRRRRVGARRKPLLLRGAISVALRAPRLVHAGRADRAAAEPVRAVQLLQLDLDGEALGGAEGVARFWKRAAAGAADAPRARRGDVQREHGRARACDVARRDEEEE